MSGGKIEYSRWETEYSRDILMYEANEDKWTKVDDLCHGRALHAMSLVPAIVEDECIFNECNW